jgi:ATP-binding cassette subfamily F protein uup
VSSAATEPSRSAKKKLSFHEKHALATLPTRIAELNAEVESLRVKLGDPALFARDPAAFNKAADELRAAEEALDATEHEWLTLEMLREELEG